MTIRLDTVATLGRHLVDPRGRCDRRALFGVTVGMLVAQFLAAVLFSLAGGDVTGRTFLAINLAFLWVGCVTLVKRLHDIGYSGWRIGPAILFWLIGAAVIVQVLAFGIGLDQFEATLAAYPVLYALLVVVISLPPFGGLLWLQASPGDAGANRFGPVPGLHGFSGTHPTRRNTAFPADAVSA
jgi:uncharacterized membrane protein YhaH (DUF805 family)